MRGSSDSP